MPRPKWVTEHTGEATGCSRDGHRHHSIQWKELYAIVMACETIVAEGTCPLPLQQHGSRWLSKAPHLVRALFFVAATNNFHVSITHIAGVDNSIADALSRFQMPKFNQLADAEPTPHTSPADPALVSMMSQCSGSVYQEGLCSGCRTHPTVTPLYQHQNSPPGCFALPSQLGSPTPPSRLTSRQFACTTSRTGCQTLQNRHSKESAGRPVTGNGNLGNPSQRTC